MWARWSGEDVCGSYQHVLRCVSASQILGDAMADPTPPKARSAPQKSHHSVTDDDDEEEMSDR